MGLFLIVCFLHLNTGFWWGVYFYFKAKTNEMDEGLYDVVFAMLSALTLLVQIAALMLSCLLIAKLF